MMKKILILAVVSLPTAALPVGAAIVTPAASTNYYFSSPLRPAHIRGEVMGVPPAYYVPRSEDVDWLAEACAERSALSTGSLPGGTSTVLVPEFGRWSMSETNRYYKWVTAVDAEGVTNVVVGYNLVTNSPPSSGAGTRIYDTSLPGLMGTVWLDGDVQLLADCRAVSDDTLNQYFTNVTYSQTYAVVATNAFSAISMPMTNGTVSVHTNEWTANMTVPGGLQPHTNVYAAAIVDFCQADPSRRFPGAFDGIPELPSVNNLPALDVYSNIYTRLRRTVRLSEGVMGSQVGGYQIVNEYYNWDGTIYTNECTSSSPYFQMSVGSSNERWYAKPFTSQLTTKFQSGLVTTGGVERVTIEAAYRVAAVQYVRSPTASGGYTNIYVTVIRRVSIPEHLTLSGTHATVSILEDSLTQAQEDIDAAGNGIPSLPDLSDTSLDAETFVYQKPHYVLIYRIHPTSKFTDW